MQVKLFVEIFQPQVVSNIVRILKADTKAALAEAARSLDAALKVSISAITPIKRGGVTPAGLLGLSRPMPKTELQMACCEAISID